MIFALMLAEMYDVPLPQPNPFNVWQPRIKSFVNTSWAANTGFGMGESGAIWVS